MFVRPRNAAVLVAFCAGFILLMQAGRWADWTVHGLLALAFVSAVVYASVRLVRGQPVGTDATAGLPMSVRRWLFGEPADGRSAD